MSVYFSARLLIFTRSRGVKGEGAVSFGCDLKRRPNSSHLSALRKKKKNSNGEKFADQYPTSPLLEGTDLAVEAAPVALLCIATLSSDSSNPDFRYSGVRFTNHI
jgi:hypothetical protein